MGLQKKLMLTTTLTMLAISPISQAFADQACPLISNHERYSKLQDAVNKLKSSITMPKECAAEQAALQERASELQANLPNLETRGGSWKDQEPPFCSGVSSM